MPAENTRGGLQEKTSDLRYRAALARRLMAEQTNRDDRRSLQEFAEELEARVDKLEQKIGRRGAVSGDPAQ
jgi:hypothetical protein